MEMLDLHSNHLTMLEPATCVALPNLVELNLGGNRIRFVGDGAFDFDAMRTGLAGVNDDGVPRFIFEPKRDKFRGYALMNRSFSAI